MTVAVVFGFAVADGLPPVVGAAPYEVLARQLPRQLVQLLNGGQDRGVRFLPFLANSNGRRSFLHLREPLAVATLTSLHQRGEVTCLVDGMLHAGGLRLRIHDGATQRLSFEADLPFAPQRPFEVLPRLQFEVMSVLGWTGRPPAPPALADATLAWYLVAKDELLALEANVAGDPAPDLLRAARHCATTAADVGAVQEVVVETTVQLLRVKKMRDDAAALLRLLAERAPASGELLRRVGALLLACGDEAGAAAVWTRAAGIAPVSTMAVETAAALWFRLGELTSARAVLVQARAAGALGASGLGQLAVVADRLGDRVLRDELITELLATGPVPVPVARLLTTFLLEAERAADARAVAEQALAVDRADAELWLDLGRACLLLDDGTAAARALRQAAALAGAGSARRDAERLLRLCIVPGLFGIMRQVDKALARGDSRAALALVHDLVRRRSDAAEVWLFLGVVRHRLGQEWRAERALKRALHRDHTLAEAHNLLGILLVGRGQMQPGLLHLQRAANLAPGDPSPQLHLAQARALLGQRGEGEQHLLQAERLGANPGTLAAIRQQFFAAGA